MKKTVAALLLLAALTVPASAAADRPEISARNAMLMTADGRVLYEKAADERALIASTTKIMTAVVALERCAADETVVVSPLAASTEGSSMHLRSGERISVGDLLCGLLLVSGNDAAVALAQHVAGSVESFALLMNKKAAEIGLENSSFKNPHGLDCEGHYSTARDMARLGAYAMENAEFCRIVSSKNIFAAGRSLVNHNRLLWRCEGATGLKTGYTECAGRTLVSAAERGGERLICVTLCDPDDWRDHEALYDWGFSSRREMVYAQKGEEYTRLPVVSGKTDTVGITAAEDCRLSLFGDEKAQVRINLPKFVYAPVSAAERAGSIELYIDGKLVKTAELLYAETAALDRDQRLGFWGRLGRRLGL